MPGRYRIVFNGEIYNYLELREELARDHGVRFTTEGDTEAVVAAYSVWGADAVPRLRGMFVFLIWDVQERVLFGARDPFGIKPLFFAAGAHGVAFASEKKSLLQVLEPLGASTAAPDPAALQNYLTLQYVPEPATLHRAVRRVESGCSFSISPGEPISVQRYFTPRFDERPIPRGDTAEETRRHEEITEVLRDSVAKHMRADVTVGSFLSGGIDSTVIAALAREHNPDLITFTTGFERAGYSEIDVAAESAEAIGVRHVVRTVTAQDMMDALPLIVWYLDDPVADPALVPLYFVANEARKHVKVVLSGEGADELFGGYTIYKEPLSLAPFDKLPGAVRKLAGALSERLPTGVRGKDLLRRGALPLEQRYYGNARNFFPAQLAAVLRGYDDELSHTDVTAPVYEGSRDWDPVARMQHVDLFTWLRGDILVKADKMTMANSLELRVPFLDPEVFRVASALPTDQKIAHGTTKYALRRAIEGIVPPHVLHRRKLGFPVPDPALARHRHARLGPRHRPRVADRRDPRQGRRAAPDRRAPRRSGRPLAAHLDAAGVHALARHLRRAAHPPGDPGAAVPGLCLTGGDSARRNDRAVATHSITYRGGLIRSESPRWKDIPARWTFWESATRSSTCSRRPTTTPSPPSTCRRGA